MSHVNRNLTSCMAPRGGKPCEPRRGGFALSCTIDLAFTLLSACRFPAQLNVTRRLLRRLYDRIPCDEDSGVTNDDVESEVDSFVPKFVQLIEAKLLQSPRTRSAVHPHKLVKLPAPDVEILDHIGCYTTINPAKSEKLVAYASELHRRRTREVEVMAEVSLTNRHLLSDRCRQREQVRPRAR